MTVHGLEKGTCLLTSFSVFCSLQNIFPKSLVCMPGFYSFLFFSQVLFWSKASTPPCRLTLFILFNYTSLGVCHSLHLQHKQLTFWEVVCAVPKPFSSTVWMDLLFWGIEDSIAQYSLLSIPLSLCCPIPYSQISSSYSRMCTKVTLVQNICYQIKQLLCLLQGGEMCLFFSFQKIFSPAMTDL